MLLKFKDLKFDKRMKLKTSAGDLSNLTSLNSIRVNLTYHTVPQKHSHDNVIFACLFDIVITIFSF